MGAGEYPRAVGRDRVPGRGATAPLLEKVPPLPFPVVVPALAGKRHAVNFFRAVSRRTVNPTAGSFVHFRAVY